MLSKTGRQTPTPKAIHPLPSIVQPGTAGKYSIAEGRGNGKGGERVSETESRKFEAVLEDGTGKKVWLTVNLLGIEKQAAEKIISEIETAKDRIKEILAS